MKAPWIALAYGYVVCLIAVVTFLIGVSSIVDATFDRASPLAGRAGGWGGASLTSFEAYRATQGLDRPTMVTRSGEPTVSDTLTTAELRARYETLRADRIMQATYQANQRLVKHGLLILLAIGLFVSHWSWLRRQRETNVA